MKQLIASNAEMVTKSRENVCDLSGPEDAKLGVSHIRAECRRVEIRLALKGNAGRAAEAPLYLNRR